MSKKKWKWRPFVTALSVIAVLVCIIVTGFAGYAMWSLRDYEPFVSDEVVPSVIEANAEIDLPPSVHDIYTHTEGFREISTQVRFAMDATDLTRFLDSTLCDEPLVAVDPTLQRESSLSWWRPVDTQYLQGCVGKREHFYQHILIDMSDPITYIVYVSASVQ